MPDKRDIDAILSGIARALQSLRYSKTPEQLPQRLTKLVERLEKSPDQPGRSRAESRPEDTHKP
jgi:hypothetical protein